jgi:vacuolar-type H+-ATPase subunit E/Vma4
MHFYENIEDKADEILDELPGDFKRQDQTEGTNNAAQFKMVLEMMEEQNEMLRKQIIATND